MKFGKQLRRHWIPEWSAYYLDYALLKKSLKDLKKAHDELERAVSSESCADSAGVVHSPESEGSPSPSSEDDRFGKTKAARMESARMENAGVGENGERGRRRERRRGNGAPVVVGAGTVLVLPDGSKNVSASLSQRQRCAERLAWAQETWNWEFGREVDKLNTFLSDCLGVFDCRVADLVRVVEEEIGGIREELHSAFAGGNGAATGGGPASGPREGSEEDAPGGSGASANANPAIVCEERRKEKRRGIENSSCPLSWCCVSSCPSVAQNCPAAVRSKHTVRQQRARELALRRKVSRLLGHCNTAHTRLLDLFYQVGRYAYMIS